MTFPHPAPLFVSRFTSIWTDFTNAYNGKTLIGSYSTGAMMPDWTNPSGASPDTAEVVALGGTISGQAFHHIDSTSISRNTPFLWALPELASVLDFEILIGVYVVSTQDGGSLAIPQGGNMCARYQTITSTDYFVAGLGLSGQANLRDRATIDEFSPSGSLFGTPTTPFNWDLNTWYWQRFRAEGGTYMLRRWPRSGAEPAGWDNTLGGGQLLTPGGLGLYLSNRDTSEQYVDFFSATIDGTTAYGPGL